MNEKITYGTQDIVDSLISDERNQNTNNDTGAIIFTTGKKDQFSSMSKFDTLLKSSHTTANKESQSLYDQDDNGLTLNLVKKATANFPPPKNVSFVGSVLNSKGASGHQSSLGSLQGGRSENNYSLKKVKLKKFGKSDIKKE